MNSPLPPPAGFNKRWLRWPLILLLVVAALVYLWKQLPGAGYSTDLNQVGAGQPTLVLAQHSHYAGGAEVMELLNDIRADYAGQVQFLVANLLMPDGQAFARRQAAHDGAVMLFDPKGQRLALLNEPKTREELRRALAQAFGL